MKRALKAGLALVAIATIGTVTANASKVPENDALIIRHAETSLIKAVRAAEQQTNGKATRAELEHGKKGWIYEVEVVANGTTYDVAVDAAKGIVLASTVDKADNTNDQDKED
ncbi:PepSY domain-containing protein [Geobacter grbiciae]|uniref:PepSY domain-containing protein n=1 Tax=Geobacter grbiciae TaxID=155042 RepID=UPI001C01BBAE|nr:PepSY domain-containing protein [Geobacter grbiciae]MBT1076245.1 PepSY domain-containing protein [Geobacter grbiciae]